MGMGIVGFLRGPGGAPAPSIWDVPGAKVDPRAEEAGRRDAEEYLAHGRDPLYALPPGFTRDVVVKTGRDLVALDWNKDRADLSGGSPTSFARDVVAQSAYDAARIVPALAGGVSEFATDFVGSLMQLPAYPALKWGSKNAKLAAVDWLDAMEKAKDTAAWGDPDRRGKYADDGKSGYHRTYGNHTASKAYDDVVELGLADREHAARADLQGIADEVNIDNALQAFDSSPSDLAKSVGLGIRDAVTMPLAITISGNPDYWLDDSATGMVMRSLLAGEGALERSSDGISIPNTLASTGGFMLKPRLVPMARAASRSARGAMGAARRSVSNSLDFKMKYPRISGVPTPRQDAKGGTNYSDLAHGLFAGDDVPDTVFGIPVVHSEEDYTEADIEFFREYPEAGGFYQMGDERDEAQGDVGGGMSSRRLVRPDGVVDGPRNWIQAETFRALGRNKFGGTIDYDAERPHYHYRDAAGKITGYGTTRSIAVDDGDGFVVIPTIVDGNLLSDEDAVKHYRDTGEYWARTADAKSADAVARRIHEEHQDRDRRKWNEYILDNWDDMADGVKADKWLAAEHARRAAREAAVRTGSVVNSVPESTASPVHLDMKGGQSPYENAEAAIKAVVPFIKEHEGFREKAYWDKTGRRWTVGHGHTRIKDPATGKMRNVTGSDTMDEATSSALVEQIVRHNAARMYRDQLWSRNVGPGALAAMYDVMYNAGPAVFGRKRSPNLNDEMESADMDFDSIVWNEIPTYVRSGGRVLNGLVNRRRDAVSAWRDAQ